MRAGFFVTMVCTTLACAQSASTSVCTPGKQEPCFCAGGATSFQSCRQDGQGYDKCECGGSTTAAPDVAQTTDPGGGTGQDVVAVADPGGCVVNYGKKCGPDNKIYYVDSCGKQGDLFAACKADEGCIGGACTANVCTPHAALKCDGNQVYNFDSCGKKESVATICKDDEFCKDDPKKPTCVKPFYDGTWKVTANPSSKMTAIGPATFADTYYKVVIASGKATFTDTGFTPPVDLVGTLDGKKVHVTGGGDEPGGMSIHHDYDMTVQFTSPTECSGVLIDSITADVGTGPAPLGAVDWTISGKKQ